MLNALNPITAGMRRSLAALGTLLLLAVAAPGASAIDTPAQGPDATDPNPLLGQTWWTMDPKWDPRWIDYHRLMSQGRTGDAALVRKLAEQPQFRWWGRWEGVSSPERKLHATFAVLDEQAPGAVPLLVSMRHLGQRCSPNYLAGGAREDALYRRWIDGFARAIGDRRVVIAFEPDSMGTVECLAKRRRKARYQTLAYGIDVLSQLPNATVYVDAGAADWQGVPLMARKLRRVGIHKVRGFMLNATHQAWTAGNIEYGRRLSRGPGRQALHHQHVPQRQRPDAQEGLDQPQAQPVADRDRVVQPAERRGGRAAHHVDGGPPRGRLHVGGAPGLLQRRLQRRSGPGGRLVARSRAPDGASGQVVGTAAEDLPPLS